MTMATLTQMRAERVVVEAAFADAQVELKKFDEGVAKTYTPNDEQKANDKRLGDNHRAKSDVACGLRDTFIETWGQEGWSATTPESDVCVSLEREGMSDEKVDELFSDFLVNFDKTIANNKDSWIPENLEISVSLRDAIYDRDRDAVEAVAYKALALDTFWGNVACTDIVQGAIHQLFCYDGRDYRYYKLWIEVAYAGYMMLMQAALVNNENNPRSLFYRSATKHIEYAGIKLDKHITHANDAAKDEELNPDFVVPTGHENRTFTPEQTPSRISRKPNPFSEFV